MAEALLRQKLAAAPELAGRVEVRSAGTHAEAGQGATFEAVRAMQARGLDISQHRAQPAQLLFPWADLVLAMTEDIAETCVRQGAAPAKVKTVGEFAGTGEEVEDPFGRDQERYERCAKQLERLLDRVVARFQQK
jgi:protein-tyrosine-phosphatase